MSTDWREHVRNVVDEALRSEDYIKARARELEDEERAQRAKAFMLVVETLRELALDDLSARVDNAYTIYFTDGSPKEVKK